jgi:lysophospholipase L1-like esterase
MTFPRVRPLSLAVGLAIALTSACSNPSSPSPTELLTISCPAPQTAASPDGNPVVVTFPVSTTGGAAPVSTSCSPTSGSAFRVGTSQVTCNARDNRERTASCNFPVSVIVPPRLTATKFVAFGDSITHGIMSECPVRTTAFTSLFDRLEDLRRLKNHGDDSASYPRRLQALLAGRYIVQTPELANQGSPGEQVSEGVVRLPGVLNSGAYQVMLLQEGVNGLSDSNVTATGEGLRTMIRQAVAYRLRPFVGTLLPERTGACRYFHSPALLTRVNDYIRMVASAEGATLVDLYTPFLGRESQLLGPDGLHPNAAGYQQMADTFFEVIRQRLEQ